MTTKDEAMQLIEKMPDDVSMEDIFSELYFEMRVDRTLDEVADGRFVSDEQARERVARCLTPVATERRAGGTHGQ
jgi:hypothetical protein